MAGSDDETLEVSSNQERRLCGLARDDDEDDLRKDATELFGSNVQAPIVPEPCDDQVEDGEENNGKRSRPSTRHRDKCPRRRKKTRMSQS